MTRTHISELPNEVLVEIFTELKDNNLIETWHKISSVCRHWRAVALEASSLWTRPPTAHHEYTLLMLDRSRRSPLEIILHGKTLKETSIKVLEHIGRISTLTILDQPNKSLANFQTTLLHMGHKASQLRSLDIQDVSSPPFKLCATTFLEPATLKSVRLDSIDVDWQIFPIHTLISLSLERLRMVNGPSWMQFLDALRGMPLLEELLFSFPQLQLHTPQIRPEALQMPYLRRLHITSGHRSVIQQFLFSSVFPQLRKVYICCASPANSDLDDYSPVVNATLSLITKGDFGCLDHGEFDANRFMLSRSSPLDWKSRPTLEFVCPNITRARLTHNAMAGISALPGERASDFSLVVCHAGLSSQDLIDLFGCLPRLESLRAYACSEVIGSLKVPTSHAADMPIPFPSVTKITLDEGGVNANLYPDLVKGLGKNLITRRKYGAELKELCLNWQLTTEEARLLQGVVVVLDFWGYRMPRRGVMDELKFGVTKLVNATLNYLSGTSLKCLAEATCRHRRALVRS